MDERLVFNYGPSRHESSAPRAGDRERREPTAPPPAAALETSAVPHPERERRDWGFIGLMAFTAILFLRPQDHVPILTPLHLAEMAAIIGLLAMAAARLRKGLPITRVTPELIGVAVFGGAILFSVPFSVWPGGSVSTFIDIYAKVLLIFALIVNVVTTPKRIEQFTWMIVLATGYIASRAVFDYARGLNLVENDRVRGAVGGIFRNPNDLALNMVAVLPLAVLMMLYAPGRLRRLVAAGCGVLMIGTIIASHSRSGSVGLAVMLMMLAIYLVRRKPVLVLAGAMVVMLALPLAPESYWHRLSSIADGSQDATGSREARRILLREGWAAFLAHPLTGVGAGQFKNYAPENRTEAWRETHNVILQVAAELGVFGLLAFGFLLVRAAAASRQVRRLGRRAAAAGAITREEAERFDACAGAMAAALAGWFVCALFASVAYSWTFYYLLGLAAAPREFLRDRLPARSRSRAAAPPAARVQEARV
jgi:O-antigen ligase